VCVSKWGPYDYLGTKRVKILKMNAIFFVFSLSEKVKYKENPSNFLLKGEVQIIFWGSKRIQMLKMNEMLFVFSHSEKINIRRTAIQILF
jgi:hypothetical protein